MAGTSADAPDLDDVARFSSTVPAGEFVFRAGDAGTDVCIVQEGRVELVDASQATEGVVDVGGVFGEGGLFGEPRDVSARAVTEVRLLRLDRAAFDRVVLEAPQVAVSMLEQVSRRAGASKAAVRRAPAAASGGAEGAPAVGAATSAPRGEPSLVEVESGTTFSLAGLDEANIGRPDRASGFAPEIDLVPHDDKRTLSRRHATIVRRDGRWFVCEQAASRNGTFVNGTRIPTGTDVELNDGDQVQFGLVRTVFQWR